MTDGVDSPAANDPTERPAVGSGGGSALRQTIGSLREVFANPNLRRVQLADFGSAVGDFALQTAIVVWVFHFGGAKAVGGYLAIRLAVVAFVSPVGAMFADRYPRKAVMVTCDVLRLLLLVVTAACIFYDLPAATVFVFATLERLVTTAFRPALRALTPSLANRPEELTASNGTTSTLESVAAFIGPALAAGLLWVVSVPVVVLFDGATYLWSALLVLGVTVAATPEPEQPLAGDAARETAAEQHSTDSGTAPGAAEQKRGFLGEMMAGYRIIAKNLDLLVVTIQVSGQMVIAGASMVFLVLMAVQIMGTGPKGLGLFDAVSGVAAIMGGFFAIYRASHKRVGQDLTTGVVFWSLPLVAVAVWPNPVVAFLAVAFQGFGNPMVDTNMATVFQRGAPDEVLGRVFGALEACLIAAGAVGAAVMPFLVKWLGFQGSIGLVGFVVAALALVTLPRMRGLDRRLTQPAELSLLRGIPMFAPLSLRTVESLVGRLSSVQVSAGEVVLREGEGSDRFYVIESGLVEVTQGGAVLRQERPGEFFGEIGLLRDVSRTATITALEDTTLLTLERNDFLAAVTGQHDAARAADEVVRRRLAV